MENTIPKQKPIHKRVIEITKSDRPGKLLDIPCGSGVLSKHFEELGFEVYKADINPGKLQVNSTNFKKSDLDGVLDFDDDTFDYCICIEGLEHVFNPHNVVKELSRVLKLGGTLYLSTPNVCRLKNRVHYLFTGISDIIEPAPLPVDIPHNYMLHVSSVPLPQLDYFCRKNGLEISRIYVARYHRKSSFFSKLLYPLLKAKLRKAYKKCRDKNAEVVRKRLEGFMLSDEVLNGEMLIVKAKKIG